jgi:divalent metal cation (Fe/Co/Zn/Cd) transporter
MITEACVAVTAGIIAGSLALTSFGFDSVIEIVSAALVLPPASRAGRWLSG